MKQRHRPLITVISLVYNNSDVAIPTLELIRNQTYPNVEHIILDDCSTDGSYERISDWVKRTDYKCRLVRNETNIGICKSLNKLLALANGIYWTGCTDDYWEPYHLERSVELLQQSGADVIYTKTRVERRNGEFLYWLHESLKDNGFPDYEKLFGRSEPYYIPERNLAVDALFYCNYLHLISFLIPVSLLRSIGGYREALQFEDWDLNFRICSQFRVCFNDSFHTIYYKHEKSFTEHPSMKVPLYKGIIQTLCTHGNLVLNESTRQRVESVIKIYSTELIKLDRTSMPFLVKVWQEMFPHYSYSGIVSSLLYRRFIARNGHLLFLGKVFKHKVSKLIKFQRA